ncbi:DUF3987 domain-containing protein [Glacieibacterium sp.]|uniref:DUF3987 domain-containing protein n=1 Tax=Glacieibacterium sp. TaxID=2860237 RepID=UPI003B00CFCD
MAAGRREPPAFPIGILPDRLHALGVDYADGAAAPFDYVALAMIGTVASAIGGSRKVQAYAGHSWTEPSILWMGAVGDPSSGKSPAISAIIEPLRDIEQEYARDFEETLRRFETDEEYAKLERNAWLAQLKDAKKEGHAAPTMPAGAVAPVKPQRPRLVVQDSTPEAVAAVLVTNRRLMSYRDELAGWFQSFDRYAPGGRTQWLESYGGRPYAIDRKNSDVPIVIPFNGVSVLGGIQPDKLSSVVLSGDDDGLAARFCWSWPKPVPYRRPRNVADPILWPRVLRKLVFLPFGRDEAGQDQPIVVPLEEEASVIFAEWRAVNASSANDAGSLFKSHVGKLPGIVLRLALALEFMDWALAVDQPEPDTVSAMSIIRARDFTDQYLKPMAMRVFGDACLPDRERDAATVARWLLRSRQRIVNLRDMRRARLPGLDLAEPLQEAVEILVEGGWLTDVGDRQGAGAGRKAKDYAVNPAVFTTDFSELE